jgi:tetratricopeptide (TPR) repeat protein
VVKSLKFDLVAARQYRNKYNLQCPMSQGITKQEFTDAETLFFEGTRCMESGAASRAEACFRIALEIEPDFAEAHANLGLLLDRQGVREDAEICYRRSISLNPDLAQTHLNLGVLLANQKRFAEAEAAYREAIACSPDAAAWSNLGVLLACMKREEEAERCYRTAMALDADYAGASFNLSYLLLRQGRFEEGWLRLEARSRHAALEARIDCPRWQGEPLAGKTLLVGFEGGYGDTIHFCRYAALLKEQGVASITLLCHPALKTLLATLDAVDRLISFDDELPASCHDLWTPILSIPYFCKTLADSMPVEIPYLRAPQDHVAKWAARLLPDGFRVGLAWKGNPLFESDTDRSLPSLDVLAPLWGVTGVRFVSLQKGRGEDEAAHPPAGLPLTNLGCEMEDFADTAAAIMRLDLVICVDTAVAHLAGALGKRCWVMLPAYKTDWRWLDHGSGSPWYPGVMRLFRQSSAGDWSGVVAEMASSLRQLTSSPV